MVPGNRQPSSTEEGPVLQLNPGNFQLRHSWHCECTKAMRTPLTSGSLTEPGVGSAPSPEVNTVGHHIEDAMEIRSKNTPIRGMRLSASAALCGLYCGKELVAGMGTRSFALIAHMRTNTPTQHRRLASVAGFASCNGTTASSSMPLRTHRRPSTQSFEPFSRKNRAARFRGDRGAG
jgi:hypothetical protein